jgi:branched-chain amino acid transport system permease protein
VTTPEQGAPAAVELGLRERLTEWMPHVVLALVVIVPFFLMAPAAWLTLTLAGLAMGTMIFIMASGLTLVFGLMDVLNFGHGAFITVGAFIGASVLVPLSGWMAADSLLLNLAAVAAAILVAMAASGALGFLFERVIVMPVYGAHLKQILITMGGMIVAEQLIHVIWGPNEIPLTRPLTFQGSIGFGEFAFEKYRLVAVAIGIVVFLAMHLVLNRTRIGLLIRAGVENGEMVEALGYRIRRVFVGVFVAGSALAGLGGVLWSLYEEVVIVTMGMHVMILIFIVVIIGGLGSVGGCLIGAVLVGLTANYIAFLAPKLALGSNILLMVAILMWRPEGLFPVARR